jgi:wobble nucleotide-excising tRNase
VALSILHLAQSGIQVFIATHSLFLLRELEMLTAAKAFQKVPCRYFSLVKDEDAVNLEQGDRVDDLQTLVLLDEELAQSDRFLSDEGL